MRFLLGKKAFGIFIAVLAALFIIKIANREDNPPVNLESEPAAAVQTEGLPRMLELGSSGCIPCDKMVPILEELREDYKGKLSVEFFDVRKDNEPAQKYRIRLIPTQIFLDAEGNEFFRHEGFFAKEDIDKVLADMGVAK